MRDILDCEGCIVPFYQKSFKIFMRWLWIQNCVRRADLAGVDGICSCLFYLNILNENILTQNACGLVV